MVWGETTDFWFTPKNLSPEEVNRQDAGSAEINWAVSDWLNIPRVPRVLAVNFL